MNCCVVVSTANYKSTGPGLSQVKGGGIQFIQVIISHLFGT